MKVLCISSQVVYGPVGNSAAVPALEASGFTVLPVPTTVLSNHPGHRPPAGVDLPAKTIAEMLDILIKNHWLGHFDSVMTGYFCHEDQVTITADVITELKRRNPKLTFLCDPVIGDDHTGIYVPLPVAEAIRDRLIPLCSIMAPNRFELEWLTGKPVKNARQAQTAALGMPPPTILVSSLPSGDDKIATATVHSAQFATVTSALRQSVPHGIGDLLSGLFLAEILNGRHAFDALATSTAILQHALDVSGDSAVLALPASLGGVHAVDPLPLDADDD